MEGDIAVGEALGFEGLVEGVVPGYPAVDGDEHAFAFGGTDKAHVIAQPAFHAAALVIVRPEAFPAVFLAAFETVHVEFAHIAADLFEVLD